MRKGVVAVSAADFNYDGQLDLLVQAENATTTPPTVSLYVYLGNREAGTLGAHSRLCATCCVCSEVCLLCVCVCVCVCACACTV